MCSLESFSRTQAGGDGGDEEGEEESLPTTGGGGASTRLDCRRVREEELDLHYVRRGGGSLFSLCVREVSSSCFIIIQLPQLEGSTYGATSLKKAEVSAEERRRQSFGIFCSCHQIR